MLSIYSPKSKIMELFMDPYANIQINQRNYDICTYYYA